jgi:hypothetical protein
MLSLRGAMAKRVVRWWMKHGGDERSRVLQAPDKSSSPHLRLPGRVQHHRHAMFQTYAISICCSITAHHNDAQLPLLLNFNGLVDKLTCEFASLSTEVSCANLSSRRNCHTNDDADAPLSLFFSGLTSNRSRS